MSSTNSSLTIFRTRLELIPIEMNVYAIGASRNIGYYASTRLLGELLVLPPNPILCCLLDTLYYVDRGATITFLLRSPSAFDGDEVIQKYVKSGKVRLVKGDALNAQDVSRGWETAREAGEGRVDVVLFTVGKSLSEESYTFLRASFTQTSNSGFRWNAALQTE